MITFDLCCDKEHVFEAWFKDFGSYKDQAKRGLIQCPVCGSKRIRKLPSPVATLRKPKAGSDGKGQEEALTAILKTLQEYVERNTEDVGVEFAETALKMHYGVLESKNIRGVATPEQERILKEEGIKFFKIPVIKKTKSGA